MVKRTDTSSLLAETVRAACLDAARVAYEDAGIRGLCAEGRWEAAVDAIRHVDLSGLTEPRAGATFAGSQPAVPEHPASGRQRQSPRSDDPSTQ